MQIYSRQHSLMSTSGSIVGRDVPLLTTLQFSTQVQVFVTGLGEFHSDINRFKLALRDFLIQLKEFSSGDNTELYLEEKEAEALMKAQAERELAMRVPGLLKPSQLEDKDEDIS